MIKYINSKESLENKMRNCQERKAKSTKMEYRGETTRKLVNIQSVRVLEIENIENQTGSKNKTNHKQSGIKMPCNSQQQQWKLKDSEVMPSNYWRKLVFQQEICTLQNFQMSIQIRYCQFSSFLKCFLPFTIS